MLKIFVHGDDAIETSQGDLKISFYIIYIHV